MNLLYLLYLSSLFLAFSCLCDCYLLLVNLYLSSLSLAFSCFCDYYLFYFSLWCLFGHFDLLGKFVL